MTSPHYSRPARTRTPCSAPPGSGPIPAPGVGIERVVLAALGAVADILGVSVEVCAALTTVAAHALSAALRPHTATAPAAPPGGRADSGRTPPVGGGGDRYRRG